MEFSSLVELWQAIEVDGLEATTERAKDDTPQTIECLRMALVEGMNPEAAKRWGAFSVLFETLVLGDSGYLPFTLYHDVDGGISSSSIAEANHRVRLRAPLREMLYICAGTQRDSTVYRARILQWQGHGQIQATGDQMLVQALQGMFSWR